MKEYVLVRMPKESREKLGKIAAAFDILKQDAAEMLIDERHRSLFGERKEPSQGFRENGTPQKPATTDGSFHVEIPWYTSAVAGLSLVEKGMMLDAIFAHAGAEHAAMPELSPLLQMALSPFFDEMDRRSATYQGKAEAGRAGGLASSKSKRLKRAEEEDEK